MSHQSNPQLELAFDFVQSTHEHIFLTGKAGTGKTTFLHDLKKQSLKRMIVVAPTGVAAINAGGVTIHSFFQLPFGPIIPNGQLSGESSPNNRSIHRFGRNKIGIIRSLDLLVIDEVSMVRADLLDGIDEVLRRFRRNSKPFGGVQLLMIGDLHQLAPVIKDEEWSLLKAYYTNGFFFSSRALQKTNYVSIELKNVYRQTDLEFIKLLNKVRTGDLDEETLETLNKRYNPRANEESEAIILTTHNNQALAINTAKLNELKEKAYTFIAKVEGEFPESAYPMDYKLVLKTGAQVMFNKNDSSGKKEYFNGKIGVVARLTSDSIFVLCPGDESEIEVGSEAWENVKYDIDEETKEIKERIIGTFHHVPLKLAWAITIHKSQGLTFDKAIIDARSAFAFGQVYVALSRCRSLEGLILSSPLSRSSIKNDQEISTFTQDISNNEPTTEQLDLSKLNFQKQLFEELFSFGDFSRRLYLIRKLANENEGSFGKELLPMLQKILDDLNAEIIAVADKFLIQINDLIDKHGAVEKNEILKERIQKAALYFSEKTEKILYKGLIELPLISDNKALKKTISETESLLNEELDKKISCLKSCHNGFDLYAFLQVRAKTEIGNDSIKSSARKIGEKQRKDIIHPELYNTLKKWRDKKAQEQKLTNARIIRQPILDEIANTLPQSMKDLAKIKGFGAQKRKLYAFELLHMVIDYLKESGIEVSEEPVPGTRYKGNTKVKSEQLSYEMFIAGLTVNQIAEERGFTQTTIEGHLSRYIEEGLIDVEKLVPVEKIRLITDYFRKTKDQSLSLARQTLGEHYTYAELRMVQAHVTFERNKV
ncbi:MAG: helicase [Bacteroidetes bacterium HGW-Bacteroidetes-21]|jgi:DNA-binding transcriptional ArsR family regulator|nr:MAG: helicase [Bacteroidetes bacterium HGW-Bacteroidetes-21]